MEAISQLISRLKRSFVRYRNRNTTKGRHRRRWVPVRCCSMAGTSSGFECSTTSPHRSQTRRVPRLQFPYSIPSAYYYSCRYCLVDNLFLEVEVLHGIIKFCLSPTTLSTNSRLHYDTEKGQHPKFSSIFQVKRSAYRLGIEDYGIANKQGLTRHGSVCLGATQLLLSYIFVGDRFHHIRTSDEQILARKANMKSESNGNHFIRFKNYKCTVKIAL